MNSKKRAVKAKELIIAASDNILKAHEFFGRKFDTLFEQGDGEMVVIEFIKLYNTDSNLQKCTKEVNHWVGIENWLQTYADWNKKNPSLF